MTSRKTVRGAMPDLMRLSKSRLAVDRSLAVEGLGHVGSPEALQIIVERTHDRSGEVRARAIEVLSKFPGIEPRYFIEALSDRDELVRIQAIESISVRKEARAIRQLRKSLTDPSDLVRSYAAAAIGALGVQADRTLLRKVLAQEKSDAARLGLLEGLWLANDRTAINDAFRLLDSDDHRVRCAAAEAMARTFTTAETRDRIRTALRARLTIETTVSAREALKRTLALVSRSHTKRS